MKNPGNVQGLTLRLSLTKRRLSHERGSEGARKGRPPHVISMDMAGLERLSGAASAGIAGGF